MSENELLVSEKLKELENNKAYLLALGLHHCRNSYRDQKSDECYKEYMSKEPSEISEIWPYLSNDVKTDYLRQNLDDLFKFVSETKKANV